MKQTLTTVAWAAILGLVAGALLGGYFGVWTL
jgi:hypothetical protein